MKRVIFIILILTAILPGCKKDVTIPVSGVVTIDNTLYGTSHYYAIGFLFSQAKLVSTLDTPEPDITIDNDGTLYNLILQSNNFRNSFYKVGEYPDEETTEQAFNNLFAVTVSQWSAMGDSVRINQVWLYRSDSDKYAKLRIISTESVESSPRDYAKCTFQWVYQADGTLTFPAK